MYRMSRRVFGFGTLGSIGAGWANQPSGAVQHGAEIKEQSGSLTDVSGIRVGHFTDSRRPTGCTAVIFDGEATAGVDYDGSSPGEMQVVMLQPVSPIERIHAMLLTGGGPMGLGAVAGAVRYLEERKIGFDWGLRDIRVPAVVGAVIDDLALGDGKIRPDPEAAYKACQSASTARVEEGNVGVGAGATVGKMLRRQGFGGMKGGLGTASLRLGEIVIGAMVVLNAAGDIVDWRSGKIIAGARCPDGKGLADLVETMKTSLRRGPERSALEIDDLPLRSTTLVVVATNVDFNKTQMTKIAMMANAGAARTIRPYHTTGDGDQLFAVSTRKLKAGVPLTVIGSLAAEVVSEAVLRAAKTASSVEAWPAYKDVALNLP